MEPAKPKTYKICGAKNRQGQPCSKPAGAGTDHKGVGKCRNHGGCVPIKHGRYSSIPRERLGKIMDTVWADPEPLDVTDDARLLRAMALKSEETDCSPDVTAEIVERAARVAEMGHKRTRDKPITLATLQRVLEQVGVIIAKHVRDPKVLADIEREWATLAVD